MLCWWILFSRAPTIPPPPPNYLPLFLFSCVTTEILKLSTIPGNIRAVIFLVFNRRRPRSEILTQIIWQDLASHCTVLGSQAGCETVGTVKIKGCLRLVPGSTLEETSAVNSCCLLIKIMKSYILAPWKMLTLAALRN